jgi:hypothetical protein
MAHLRVREARRIRLRMELLSPPTLPVRNPSMISIARASG